MNMDNREEESRVNRYRTRAMAIFLLYAGLAFLYISIGGAVLIFNSYWSDFSIGTKIAFGILCIAYGLFRMYRAYVSYQQKLEELE
ncbi:MAG: hypothetical protein ACKV1O_10935 [Saprospiraceae bacterium]